MGSRRVGHMGAAAGRRGGRRQWRCACSHACSRARCLPHAAPVLHRTRALWQEYSDTPSHPDDPLGLTTSNAARLRGCPPGATTATVREETGSGVLQLVVPPVVALSSRLPAALLLSLQAANNVTQVSLW